MNESLLRSLRAEGYNCAETILRHANTGYDLGLEERSLHLVSGFGGGAMTEDFCGALAGAVAALSIRYGHGKAHDSPALEVAVKAFLAACKEEIHPSTLCREIKPEWRSETEGCTPLIVAVAKVLDRWMAA